MASAWRCGGGVHIREKYKKTKERFPLEEFVGRLRMMMRRVVRVCVCECVTKPYNPHFNHIPSLPPSYMNKKHSTIYAYNICILLIPTYISFLYVCIYLRTQRDRIVHITSICTKPIFLYIPFNYS